MKRSPSTTREAAKRCRQQSGKRGRLTEAERLDAIRVLYLERGEVVTIADGETFIAIPVRHAQRLYALASGRLA